MKEKGTIGPHPSIPQHAGMLEAQEPREEMTLIIKLSGHSGTAHLGGWKRRLASMNWKLEASLRYRARPCLKQQNKVKIEKG